MGNTTSEAEKSGIKSNERFTWNDIAKEQETNIQRLQQELDNANRNIRSQDEIILLQSTMIQDLKKEIRGSLSDKITRDTQTDQDDIDNHSAVLHRTQSIASANVEYDHHVTDRLLDVRIERSRNAEPPGTTNFGVVRVLNASNLPWSYALYIFMCTKIPSLGAGEKLYYHGSNDRNIKCILENGIDVTKSFRATDFSCGRGFYVTEDFGKAVEWSMRVRGWKGGNPAVIAFRISQDLQMEEPHLALTVDTTTNRKWWECVVSHFRHSATSTYVGNVLKDVKFITGPVANNRYLLAHEIPRPFYFTQLCIQDEGYALRFGSLKNIAFVIFGVDA